MKPPVVERYGKLEDLDRRFDLEFWQAQSDEARLNAGWELVVQAWILKGKDAKQLRLDRTAEYFGPQRR